MDICLGDIPTALAECDDCGEIEDCYQFEVMENVDFSDSDEGLKVTLCHACYTGNLK